MLLDTAPFIAACAILLLVFGLISIITFPLIAVAAVAQAIYLKRERNSKQHEMSLFESSKALRAMDDALKKGRCLLASIETGERTAGANASTRKFLHSIRCRLLLGQPLPNAIASESQYDPALAGAFRPLGSEYEKSRGVLESPARAAIVLEKERAEQRSNEQGRLPRYLILAMVTSTILPSMLTFAFVGYSILASSAFILLVYCAILLGVLPCAYSAVRTKLSVVYNG